MSLSITAIVLSSGDEKPGSIGALAPYWRLERVQQKILVRYSASAPGELLRLEEKLYQHPRQRPMTAMERKALRPKLAALGLIVDGPSTTPERTFDATAR
jgi:hypothetical protein